MSEWCGRMNVGPLVEIWGDGGKFLGKDLDAVTVQNIRKHSRTGRPLGSREFVEEMEKKLGRKLAPPKKGAEEEIISIVSPNFPRILR